MVPFSEPIPCNDPWEVPRTPSQEARETEIEGHLAAEDRGDAERSSRTRRKEELSTYG